MTFLSNNRSSGILAHVTCLPSPYGIGDIGPSSYNFLDFLKKSGQGCWQILPTGVGNPVFDNSPYMSSSAFAGSPLLISLDLLLEDNLILREELEASPLFSKYTTEFTKVTLFKTSLLKKAFSRFNKEANKEFNSFVKTTNWLEDYSLFMALKNKLQGLCWYDWPEEIKQRDDQVIGSLKSKLSDQINYYNFEQFIFFKQWQLLKDKAVENNIKIFGDIPIYVSLDSADVWANPDIFLLDSMGKPTHVSGVPPDYFAKTGQKWGNPLYRWNDSNSKIQHKLLTWWIKRFESVFKQVDIARIDHFRAFESYWSIPADKPTAIEGQWKKGPGKEFFDQVFNKLGTLNIVAEDLGIITEAVTKLRDSLSFPGMKVIQFGFDGNPSNSFLPHNFQTTNCVCYTGTHDNNTTVGWFLDNELDDTLRTQIKSLANRSLHDDQGIHDDFIYLSHSSIARLSMIPLQDLLGFGGDCRTNTPGIASGNWRWRCAPEFLTDELANKLFNISKLFGR